MQFDEKALKKRLSEAIQNVAEHSRAEGDEIAFHMTDWLRELEALCEIFGQIETADDEAIYDCLMSFLIHAPEHIFRAAELFTEFPPQGIFSDNK